MDADSLVLNANRERTTIRLAGEQTETVRENPAGAQRATLTPQLPRKSTGSLERVRSARTPHSQPATQITRSGAASHSHLINQVATQIGSARGY
jgi:hypothetical protein